MGNEFMEPRTNDFKFNPTNPGQNTTLHNYIRDFYKNNFKFAATYDGPKFEKGKNPNEMIAPMLADNKGYKRNTKLDDGILSYSKKRACCLNSLKIPLSLPSYDTENKKVVYSTLQFPIFSSEELNDANTCKDEGGENVRPTKPPNSDYTAAGTKCSIFYADKCQFIHDNRHKNYTLTDMYKGPYVNPAPTVVDRTTNKYGVINPFLDCGCLNSPFMKGVKAKGDVSGSPDQITQTVGTDCAPYMANNRVFYNTYEKLKSLCITSVDLSDSKLTAVNGNILIDAKSNCGGASTDIKATDKTVKEREEKEAKEKAEKEAKEKAEKEAKDKADKEAAAKAAAASSSSGSGSSGSGSSGSGSSGSGSSGSGSSGSGSTGSGSSGSGSSGSGSSGSGSSGSGSSGSGSTGSGSTGSGSSGSGSTGSGSSGSGSSGSGSSGSGSSGSGGSNNTSGGSTAPPEAPKSFLSSEMIKGVPNLYLIAGIVIILIILVFMFSGKGSNNRPSNYDNYE